MEKNCNLELLIGKPVDSPQEPDQTKIATFTRFVLPFAYKLEERQSTQIPDLHYTINSTDDLSFIKRKNYFTRETAEILYEKAFWLDMCDLWPNTIWGQENVEVILRGKKIKIGMLPPRITLFEASEGRGVDSVFTLDRQQEANIQHTGFLQVDIYFSESNEHKPELDDLLLLNEFFRYFGIPWDEHARIFKNNFGNIPVSYSLSNSSIKVKDLNQLECYFERWANLLEIPVIHNDIQYRLFPKNWAQGARDWSYNNNKDNQDEHWQIYSENRAYVWTAAFLKNGGHSLKACFEPKKDILEANDYGHWIKLLNVDAPDYDLKKQDYKTKENTHSSVTQFEKKWADERTYQRWESKGTWYGFCYYCGATIAPPFPNIFAPVKSYYFDMCMYLFYQRMTVFRISHSLAEIVSSIKGQSLLDNLCWVKPVAALRLTTSRVSILYRSRMISNQQQAIEMYELAENYMNVDGSYRKLQGELDNLHDQLELFESNRLGNAAHQLALWGIPLAVGGLVTALFSIGDINIWECWTTGQNCALDGDRFFQVLLVTVVMGVFVAGFRLKQRWKNKGEKK